MNNLYPTSLRSLPTRAIATRDFFIKWLVALLVFWQILTLIVWKDSLPAALLGLMALALIPKFSSTPAWKDPWVIAILTFASWGIFSLAMSGVSEASDYERWSRWALAAPIAVLIACNPPPRWILEAGCGAAVSVTVSMIYFDDSARASLSRNPNTLAFLITPLALLCLTLAWQTKNGLAKLLLLIIGLAGIWGIAQAQSRGAMACIAAFGLYLGFEVVSVKNNRWRNLILIATTTFAIGIGVSQTKFSDRIFQAAAEVKQILEGNLGGSIGLRLQLHQTALVAAADAPIIGHGPNFESIATAYMTEANSSALTTLHHFHNQYLDLAAKHGFPATVFFLILMACLWWHPDRTIRIQCACIAITLAVGGISETVLASGQLGILTALLPSVIRAQLPPRQA